MFKYLRLITPQLKTICLMCFRSRLYWGADKSLARPGRKQARNHVRDARDVNKIETRAVIEFLFLQGKAPKEIHAISTETLACFLLGRDKDLSAPLYISEAVVVPPTRDRLSC